MKGLVPDAQRTQADTCCEVSALDGNQNSSDHDARNTIGEYIDMLPLDSLIDIDNLNDTKVS